MSPITREDYERAKEIIVRNDLKPSDALHIAVILDNSIRRIVSEDRELDRVKGIERVWLR